MQISYWPGVFALIIGIFMSILDTSIVNVALPKMMNVFGVSTSEIQWVLTAYTMAMAAVIPLTGYLCDRFGMKRMYLISFILFTVGSLFCGLAWSNNSMIVARIIQALGGGLIMPVGQALIFHTVPEEKMGAAMGIFGISAMVAPAIGPTLSGYIVEYLDWRIIFTINVPIGLIGILMAWTFLQETEIKKDKVFDFPGFIYSTVMLTSLLLAVAKGEEKGWTSFYIVSLIMISIICLSLFIYRQLTARHPLINIRLFTIPDFTYGVIVNSLIMVGMFGVVFLLPIYAESLLGLTAMKTGMMMLPQVLVQMVVTFVTSAILMRIINGKWLILAGLLIISVNGYYLIRLDDNTAYEHIQFLLMLRGIGLGLCMMVSMQVPLQGLDKSQSGDASALMNTTRQVATSIGVAILTSVFQTQGVRHAVHYAETITGDNATSSSFLNSLQQMYIAQGMGNEAAYASAINSLTGLVKKYATIHALDDAILVTTFFIISAIPMTLLLKGKQGMAKNEKTNTIAEM
ncbi:DHA2 family efflux MFS transporter permease subunit [Aneurinibacillus thermoaerophilus]|uniref:DHA2 family efflux MFS transporter permease subunit n=1 Tax=Aneurinibacillus thermoaerophilus TaxID=143495 RepID=A0ABX8Y7G0_ANETH|nr:DHA2 family efflux MFS transporter permease subunit [Aneurinibacillus thermoaerophilus]MED0680069.1 DHA2 family efflux MFS transporter permease subunit [Aneurinibacillus thermoaerophilus]MED0738173.1 DHA2 family efflux MFS transporter permease subunit [Aneurinibacillus thermoaerophilus]MED0763447.1 DHA2 family efflux MFS transporter permease subunit [Aneurinibacillus thermoaerophilus]QYY41392.1 DHA2 family efflux MFS transporter permease subunit [Aneurinibacillus thermoaerophilus]